MIVGLFFILFESLLIYFRIWLLKGCLYRGICSSRIFPSIDDVPLRCVPHIRRHWSEQNHVEPSNYAGTSSTNVFL